MASNPQDKLTNAPWIWRYYYLLVHMNIKWREPSTGTKITWYVCFRALTILIKIIGDIIIIKKPGLFATAQLPLSSSSCFCHHHCHRCHHYHNQSQAGTWSVCSSTMARTWPTTDHPHLRISERDFRRRDSLICVLTNTRMNSLLTK